MTVHILDYGLGNLRSLSWAIERIGCDYIITNDPDQLNLAKKIIIPGVGSFGVAMANLKSLNLVNQLQDKANDSNISIFGICLGMQILFETSAESPGVNGLGILKGHFEPLEKISPYTTHMGWNNLTCNKSEEFKYLDNIPSNADFYFVHSFGLMKNNIKNSMETHIDSQSFCSYIEYDNITCAQFHPEKSHTNGLLLLKNWINN